MIKFITDLLIKRRQNNIRKKVARLQEQAMHFQRNGKLRLYAEVMNEITKLEKEQEEIHGQ